MFSTKLGRAAPRATAALSQSSSKATSNAQQTTRCLATRPSHQRRHSSSKASPPSDSTASGKPAPAAKAKEPVPAEKKRNTYRRSAGTAVGKRKEEVDQFAGLPSVPSLQGLELPEVKSNLAISSFFSMHRPISLTTPIPPIVSEQTFSSIFSARDQQDPWRNGNSAERRPEDIIITLNNTIEMLEGHQSQSDNEGVRWEVLNESRSNSEGGVKHLDGVPQPRVKSLDELVANFRPFRAPPPPEPFDEKYVQRPTTQKKSKTTKNATARARKPKQKVYVTEIRVTESTHEDGRKTYAASSTPIRRLQEEQAASPTTDLALPSGNRQTFLQRVRRRQEKAIRDEMARVRSPILVRKCQGMGWRRKETWVLISVKRQRKLKMKKHKHKKLMKRTRNERRRLGRT